MGRFYCEAKVTTYNWHIFRSMLDIDALSNLLHGMFQITPCFGISYRGRSVTLEVANKLSRELGLGLQAALVIGSTRFIEDAWIRQVATASILHPCGLWEWFRDLRCCLRD